MNENKNKILNQYVLYLAFTKEKENKTKFFLYFTLN